MNAVAGLILIALATASALDLPTEFMVCKKSDPKFTDCLGAAVTDAVVKLRTGLKPFKILPLEPMKVTSISIGGSEGSVSLKQEYRNVELHGLTRNLQIKKTEINWNKFSLFMESYNPHVDFAGDYEIDGRILLLPIRGKGRSNITMLNLKSENSVQFESYKKDGEAYMRVKEFKVKFTPMKVHLKFENLFDGDPTLARPMETFLNENANLLFKELQAPYEKSFGLVFAKVANELFSRVPMSKIFPE